MKIRNLAIAAMFCCFTGPVHAGINNLWILGDSLSDTNNLFGGLKSALAGDPFGFIPSDNYFYGRFSNGPNWSDYYNFLNPSVNIINRAIGGAFAGSYGGRDNTLDNDLNEIPLLGSTLAGIAAGFQQQVSDVPNVDPLNNTFAVWIGANDFISATDNGFSSPLEAFLPVTGSLLGGLQSLVGKGARDFLLFNLPDLGATPAAADSGQQAALSQATVAYNDQIARIADLGNSYGLNMTVIDVYTSFATLLNNPEQYGFTDTTGTCIDGAFDDTLCADPDARRVFWDQLHPTTLPHYLVADLVDYMVDTTRPGSSVAAAFSSQAAVVPVPAAIWLFVGGLVGLGARSRCHGRQQG